MQPGTRAAGEAPGVGGPKRRSRGPMAATPIVTTGTLERFSYDDDIVRKFTAATLLWGLVGTLVGLVIALELVLPSLNPAAPSPGLLDRPWLTLLGAWDKVAEDPILKFFVEGSRSTGCRPSRARCSRSRASTLSHYTDWTIAHVHGGAIGWVRFIEFSARKPAFQDGEESPPPLLWYSAGQMARQRNPSGGVIHRLRDWRRGPVASEAVSGLANRTGDALPSQPAQRPVGVSCLTRSNGQCGLLACKPLASARGS